MSYIKVKEVPKKSTLAIRKRKEYIVCLVYKEKGQYWNQCLRKRKPKKDVRWSSNLGGVSKIKFEVSFSFPTIYNNLLYDDEDHANKLEKEIVMILAPRITMIVKLILSINSRKLHYKNSRIRERKIKSNFENKN